MVKTNLGKTKEEIIYELTLSLICGGKNQSSSATIEYAEMQYNALKEKGYIIEEAG